QEPESIGHVKDRECDRKIRQQVPSKLAGGRERGHNASQTGRREDSGPTEQPLPREPRVTGEQEAGGGQEQEEVSGNEESGNQMAPGTGNSVLADYSDLPESVLKI